MNLETIRPRVHYTQVINKYNNNIMVSQNTGTDGLEVGHEHTYWSIRDHEGTGVVVGRAEEAPCRRQAGP